MYKKLKNKLRSYLCKDVGFIMNTDNGIIKNDGKNLTIIIPLKSFEKYGYNIINESETTIHKRTNGEIVIGKSIATMKENGGFDVEMV